MKIIELRKKMIDAKDWLADIDGTVMQIHKDLEDLRNGIDECQIVDLDIISKTLDKILDKLAEL